MKLRNRLLTLIGAGLLTAAIAITALLAGHPLTTLAADPAAATPAAGQAAQNDRADFLAKLAANLGISQDALTAAIKQADLQQIDAAAAAGTLTADQAQAARDRVNNSTGAPPLGVGLGDKQGGRGRGLGDEGALRDAAASFFGITADQFRQDIQSAGSLQGVAAKYGKDNAADKANLEAALESALRQALTAKGVDATRIDQETAAFKQNFGQYYASAFGHRGPAGSGGQRGPQAAPSTAPATPATGQ